MPQTKEQLLARWRKEATRDLVPDKFVSIHRVTYPPVGWKSMFEVRVDDEIVSSFGQQPPFGHWFSIGCDGVHKWLSYDDARADAITMSGARKYEPPDVSVFRIHELRHAIAKCKRRMAAAQLVFEANAPGSEKHVDAQTEINAAAAERARLLEVLRDVEEHR